MLPNFFLIDPFCTTHWASLVAHGKESTCQLIPPQLPGSDALQMLTVHKELSWECGLIQRSFQVGGQDRTYPIVDYGDAAASHHQSPGIHLTPRVNASCPDSSRLMCLTVPFSLPRVWLLERAQRGAACSLFLHAPEKPPEVQLLVWSLRMIEGKGLSHVSAQLQSEVKEVWRKNKAYTMESNLEDIKNDMKFSCTAYLFKLAYSLLSLSK